MRQANSTEPGGINRRMAIASAISHREGQWWGAEEAAERHLLWQQQPVRSSG